MKYYISLFLCAVFVSFPCIAAGGHHAVKAPRLTVEPLWDKPLTAGQEVNVTFKIRQITDGLALTDMDLKTVHTQKVHVLIIDPSFTDYQHLHPTPSSTPGAYQFRFIPKHSGSYKMWVDVTPKAIGEQQLVNAWLGDMAAPAVTPTVAYNTVMEGYHFTLTFDSAPKAGEAAMGMIHIVDANKRPVKTLQPVMGAFAHIVGFYEDYEHIVHIHPMGEEPTSATMRGGPDLEFHMEPQHAGFIKLFAQVNIDGKELFVPFGVQIKP